MAEPQQPLKVIVVDPGSSREAQRLSILAQLEILRLGEESNKVLLVDEPDPASALSAIRDIGASLKTDDRIVYDRFSPWDRGNKSLPGKVKESMAAMMARVARTTKPLWKTPTLEELNVCNNCDADTDDGEWRARHANDAYCKWTWEDEDASMA